MDNHQRRPLKIFRNTVRVVAQRDWLGSLIGVTRNLRDKRRLFRDLAEKVVRITVGLHDEVVADESVVVSPRFIQTCLQFSDCLSSVAEDLKEILHRRKSWLTTAVGTRLGVQLIHTDLTRMRSALLPRSSDTGAESKFSDFYRLIPADVQLLLPPQRAPSAETLEGPVEYPVLVHGVRMTARLYRGDNALEQWRDDFHLFSSIRKDLLTAISSGVSDSFPGIHQRCNCSDIATLLVDLLSCFIIIMNRSRTRTQHTLTYRPSAAVFKKRKASKMRLKVKKSNTAPDHGVITDLMATWNCRVIFEHMTGNKRSKLTVESHLRGFAVAGGTESSCIIQMSWNGWVNLLEDPTQSYKILSERGLTEVKSGLLQNVASADIVEVKKKEMWTASMLRQPIMAVPRKNQTLTQKVLTKP
ncbi:hypothetical protein DFH08DRAFT_799949 [Mycena albidolilacea]|uniref:Uncharacterized protein n=1 Tax=Mycena albidolilacea TaxID=1033008 RepID=A0AAD7AMT9_9AGAR|nr:hypothetical protein DFH08DRAFT_799949 [Mycena albidolilacea]